MSTVAERVRKQSRVTVLMPELQETFEFRTYSVEHMMETGINGKILDFMEESETAEADAEKILQENKDIIIACSINPILVYGETKQPGHLSIKDVPDGDIVHAFQQVVTVSSSRFFGVNRTTFGVNPEACAKVIDGQMLICYQVDVICSRWSELYDDVMLWPSWKLTEAIAVIEGAEGYRKAHPPAKEE